MWYLRKRKPAGYTTKPQPPDDRHLVLPIGKFRYWPENLLVLALDPETLHPDGFMLNTRQENIEGDLETAREICEVLDEDGRWDFSQGFTFHWHRIDNGAPEWERQPGPQDMTQAKMARIKERRQARKRRYARQKAERARQRQQVEKPYRP